MKHSIEKTFIAGFTLVELLVVISIIALLASIVLASLNSARGKGSQAAIEGNLRNMADQAELIYTTANPNSYSAVCSGLANGIGAIANDGGTSGCYTYDGTRWGVSATLNSDHTKNYSVDSTGVVVWDSADISGSAMTWSAANAACAAEGEHLPSFEELKALSLAYGSVTPPSFQAHGYWSGTVLPSDSTSAFVVSMTDGTSNSHAETESYYVRCLH